MIRNIKIINKNNDVYDLNDTKHIGTDISGLGADVNGTYVNINENFVNSDSYINQGTFSTNIIFGLQGSNAYNEFKNFSEFISSRNAPLYMQYTVDDEQYLRDIEISSISKTEKDDYGLLTSQASFKYTTPWYKIKTYTEKDFSNNSLVVENESNMIAGNNQAPVRILIKNGGTNPYWSVRDRQNSSVMDDRYLGTVPSDKTLIVDSRPSQYTTVLYNNFETTNVRNSMDFINTNGFVVLNPGSNEITIKNAKSYEINIFEYRSLV